MLFLGYLGVISAAGQTAYHLSEHTRRTPKNWYLLWVNLRRALMLFGLVSLAFAGFVHLHLGSNDVSEEVEGVFRHLQREQLGQLALFGLFLFFV